MAYRDLHDFVNFLSQNNDLKKIDVQVDRILEIPEISDRIVKQEDSR